MSEGALNDHLAQVLFAYRITPHGSSDMSPAELMFQCKLKSRLDLLRPTTPEALK